MNVRFGSFVVVSGRLSRIWKVALPMAFDDNGGDVSAFGHYSSEFVCWGNVRAATDATC